ncbi:GTP cyclohydrolase I, putative [Plasmodium chabaudi chabaudi]|uniref:GTP cyclohydrolase 1 n=2 Tax=Plasmodium chabaudi TaxID=5825 RepID=A0A1C6YT25_PLACU|nr:GTP cyclohydrolase I [Plasmodium chabaudi]SCM26518.1 GTP cyclohydrolase I, putative [Plasmodium chabaudi chabaudi]
MDAYVEKKQVDEDYLLSIRKNETTNILEKNQSNNFSNDTTQSISLVHPKSVNNKNSDDKKIGKGNKDNNNFIINDLEKQTNQISINILNILKASNIPDRDILKRTSNRFAKAFLYLTEGYNMNVKNIIKKSIYKRKYKNNSLIKIKDIHVYSLCKHHLLPFEGLCDIEYNPDKYIMGLSKFSRVTDIYARRLQLQEDLTNDICNALKKYLKPLYIKVTIKAKHLCINMRGVKEHDAMTVTHASYVSKQGTNCFKEHINSSENEIPKLDTPEQALS